MSTGFGEETHGNRVTAIYQSMNKNKIYEFFGLRFYRENQTIPRKLAKSMILSEENIGSSGNGGLLKCKKGGQLNVNVWGKTKVMKFLEGFDTESSVNEKVLEFMEDLETRKLDERAAEWIDGMKPAARRDLYKLPSSAYQGNRHRGLRAIKVRDFQKRVYVSRNR